MGSMEFYRSEWYTGPDKRESLCPGIRQKESFMTNRVKKIWDLATTLVVGLAVAFALLLAGARLVGLQVFTVISGSMEPAYPVGSLIYVRKTDNTRLEAGDVITFLMDESTVATHRIVEVLPDETDPAVVRYRTKGDANPTEDGALVHEKNVLGTPIFTIPYLGYAAQYIQNPPGTYLAVSAGAALLLLVFLPELLASDKPERKAQPRK